MGKAPPEFAGALAELIRGSFARDFPAGLLREAREVLLEAQDHLLLGMPVRLQEYVRERLFNRARDDYFFERGVASPCRPRPS